MKQKKRVRLVLFPCPLQGHINPMLQLASILHSKGFSITIVHPRFNAPNPSNYPQFDFIPIPDGISDFQVSTSDVLALLSLLNVNCAIPLRDCLVRLISDCTSNAEADERVPCLISDSVMYFTQVIADSLKLRRLMVHTSSIAASLAICALPTLRNKGYLPILDSQLEMPVMELPPLKVKDLPVFKTNDTEMMCQFIDSEVNQIKASDGVIANSFIDLEQSSEAILGQQLPLIPLFTMGPFHKFFPASSGSSLKPQEQNCITWLDNQAPRSVMCVSFGSLASMDESEFVEIAWGLAYSKCPFLWVVRSGLINEGSEQVERRLLWPDGFLEMVSGKGLIVRWAPQLLVLGHPSVGGFWTHNGWNSTLESICEGVPMLCRPISGDQKVNARFVSDVWRVGLLLENKLKRGEIGRNITKLMVEKEGEEMRQRVTSLKEKANACIINGGSSYQSLEDLVARILSF